MKTPLLSLLLSLLLTACTTFKSNVDPSAVPEFSRILVVSRLPVNSHKLLSDFTSVFPPQYSVCALGINKLGFGKPDSLIQQKIRECHSDVVLTVTLQENYGPVPTRYGYAYSVSPMFFEMTSVATGKSFWKASYAHHTLYPRKVAKQLRADGIISGNIPVLNPPHDSPKY